MKGLVYQDKPSLSHVTISHLVYFLSYHKNNALLCAVLNTLSLLKLPWLSANNHEAHFDEILKGTTLSEKMSGMVKFAPVSITVSNS